VLESLGFIDSLVVLFSDMEEGIPPDTLGATSLTYALIIWSDGTFITFVLDRSHGVKLPKAQACDINPALRDVPVSLVHGIWYC
jgi:hypothetical protein